MCSVADLDECQLVLYKPGASSLPFTGLPATWTDRNHVLDFLKQRE